MSRETSVAGDGYPRRDEQGRLPCVAGRVQDVDGGFAERQRVAVAGGCVDGGAPAALAQPAGLRRGGSQSAASLIHVHRRAGEGFQLAAPPM